VILRAQSAIIRPYADGSDDLGSDSFRFNKLFLKTGVKVAGLDTIDSNGRVNINAIPRDTAGLIIEAQGAGFYPMYVNPNGRYAPATHDHANLYPSGGVNTGKCGDTTTYWNVVAGDSVWYNALGHMDFMDDLAIIKGLRMSKKIDKLGIPLIDNRSLPEAIRSKSGLIHGGHLLGLALGAIKQLNAKVDELSRKLEAYESRYKVSG
jgi:hypothetical protein